MEEELDISRKLYSAIFMCYVNILLSSDESSRSDVVTYCLQVTASQNR